MNLLIKNLSIVILAIGVLLILVIVRYANPHIFKQKVKSVIEATQNNSNIITPGSAQSNDNTLSGY